MRAVLPLLAALLLLGACRTEDPALPGTTLNKTPAADFRLMDQEGRSVALSELRGRVVVLTFLYTSCTDICPVTAVKLRQTLEHLGRDAARVELVAVSVDPERDDRAAARGFTERHGLPGDNWHYLTGSEEELAPVWSAYGIARRPRTTGAPGPGASPADMLGHTDALYVLDREGRRRTLLRGDFDPAELAEGLRKLVR